ncbi:MAG: cytochrome C [Desulfuromonadales bacterium]|uniref:cytochrome C n=1 Tax=Desulfuromonas sp. KJ2020 TaxID=2919173 RepID=UPI000323BBBC|nr:cytochrome C [Desulfuromonas sp. KJ2020]MCP3178293.1 cytochrome C [Desulfuromonas sp. KJ2020]
MKRFALMALGLTLVLLAGKAMAADEATKHVVPLEIKDCIKCHMQAVRDVNTKGGKHQTAVNCQDCHLEHPPMGSNAIPECSMCHDAGEKAHYALENCQSCHYPHYPMEMDFTQIASVKPVCLTCHAGPGQEMEAYPSMHAQLDCKECHLTHGQATACNECHAPHSSDMTYQDCLRCHKPHMPLVVKYADDLPSPLCGSCHGDVSQNLTNTSRKHGALLCAYCHKGQHKVVPECSTCHGLPHGSAMHSKFPNCLDCHLDAHALDMPK